MNPVCPYLHVRRVNECGFDDSMNLVVSFKKSSQDMNGEDGTPSQSNPFSFFLRTTSCQQSMCVTTAKFGSGDPLGRSFAHIFCSFMCQLSTSNVCGGGQL